MARKGRAKKFKCGPHEWREYLVPKDYPALTVDGDRCDGLCVYETCEIYLNKDLPAATLRMVRLHERTHAAWYSYVPDSIRTEHEETIVDGISKGLHQIDEQTRRTRK